MLVQDIMHQDVTVVGPRDTLAAVERRLRPRGIRHVPVVDAGGLVGIVSDRDVKSAMASAAPSQGARGSAFDELAVADVMAHPVITVAPSFPVEEAARLMVTKRISALPVTEAGRLVGIVTDTDLLQLFVRAMGVTEPSSRIDVTLSGSRSLERAVRIVADAGAQICSIMSLVSPTTGARELVIRLATINPGPAIKALEAEDYPVRESWRGR